MANTFQTPDKILKKCLAVLHAKLNFIGSIHRDYDDQFAHDRAEGKPGATLRVRLPEQYVAVKSAIYQPQPIYQNSVVMTVATQQHVGMKLTSADLALKDEDFEERHVLPAMSALATAMEADAFNMVLDIYNMIGTAGGGAPTTMLPFGKARARLNKMLAPDAGMRACLMDSDTSALMADGLKALFNDQSSLSHSFLEGYLTRGQGFSFMENDLLPTVTNGTRSISDSPTLNGDVTNGATSLVVQSFTGSATIKQGEVFTLANIYAVHPETKAAFTDLQQFVVTEDVTLSGGGGTVKFSPAAYWDNTVATGTQGLQNISAKPASGIAFQVTTANNGSGAASGAYQQLLAYHKDAFAFVCADLPLYPDQVFMARKTIDKLSMRIWKWADGTNDTENTRIDVLYGYKTLRPQLACRITK